MRNAFSEALYEEATRNPDVYVVVADISPVGSMARFSLEYPERFINVGVAEQVMIGICAGLALKGRKPFAYTIANFSLYRPFEMVRDDLCYQRLPVTVVGMGAGVIYANHGATHHTQEDIAVAGAIPNMQIVAPCDPLECVEATRWCARQTNGPVYLRLGKAGEPVLTREAEPWQFGRIRHVRRGREVCILSYGVITKVAVEIADELQRRGKSVSLVSVHTMKPIDREGIAGELTSHGQVLVIEEHAPQGGLASQVKQIAWDIRASCGLHTFTLQDTFIHNYGSHADMLAAHGLSARQILERIE